MATIVQPYNPWREQLALTALGNTLGGIIGDLWTQHKQNEQNKKANAFRNQLLQDIQSQTQTQNVSAPLLSLGMQNTPDTINPDGWSDTFHKSYNPLPMFDLAANSSNQANSLPSANDVQRIGSNLAATKRFAMLSPETVHGFISQINQQNEQQRLKDLQAGYADMFRNANSFDEQLKALALANMFGVGGDKAITPLASWAIHSTPNKTFQQIDAGNNIYGVSFDPKSGQINPSTVFPVGMTPYQKASIEAQNYATDRNNDTHLYGYDVNAVVEREKNSFSYEVGKGKNDVDAIGALITSLDNEEKSLTKQLGTAQWEHSMAETKEEHYATQAEIDRINGELQTVRQRRKELMQNIMPQRNQASQAPLSQTIAPIVLGANNVALPQPQPQVTASPATGVPMILGSGRQTIFPVSTSPNTGSAGNISNNVQVAKPKATPVPQPRYNLKKKRFLDLPDEILFDPSRDKDIPSEKIYSLGHFTEWLNNSLLPSKEFSHLTPEQIVQLAISQGFRIKN